MLKKIIAVLISALLLSHAAFAQGPFTDYTTVRYTDRWTNYIVTTPEQADAGLRGADCSQICYAMDFSPAEPDIVYAGTDCSGIYKSTDCGKTWYICQSDMGAVGIIGIKCSPYNKDTVFAAAAPTQNSDTAIDGSNVIGIWKTENGGKSWRQTGTMKFRRLRQNSIFEFGENGRIFAGARDGLFVSDDNGESWRQTLSGCEILDIDRFGETVYIVTNGDGIFKSTDNGETFQTVTVTDADGNSLYTNEGICYAVRINPENENHIIVSAGKSLCRSFDGGETWETCYKIALGNYIARIEYGAKKHDGSRRLYITVEQSINNFRYSDDYGCSFTDSEYSERELLFNKNETGYYAAAFAVHPSNPNIIMNTPAFRSTDGGKTLKFSGTGFSGARAAAFRFDPERENYMLAGFIDQGVVYSGSTEEFPPLVNNVYQGMGYQVNSSGTTTAVTYDPRDKNRILTAVAGVIKESTDGGLTYQTLYYPETRRSIDLLEFNANDNNIIYSKYFISRDNGENWSEVPDSIGIIAVSPINSDIVYGVKSGEIYRSLNCGNSFEKVNTSLNVSANGIQKVHADYDIEGRLYIGTFWSGLFILNPDGSYKNIKEESGLVRSRAGTLSIHDIAQDHADHNHLAAGGADAARGGVSAGLFESFDRGESWHVVPDMPGVRDIWTVEFHPVKQQIYTGTSNGIMVYDFSDRKQTLMPILPCSYVDILKAN